jgi:hypothetical protein
VPEGEELHRAWAASVFSGRQLPSLVENAPIQSADETLADPWCDDLFTPHPLYEAFSRHPGLFRS